MGAVGWGGLTWALLRLSSSLFAFGTLPSLSLLFPSSGHGCSDPLTPFAWRFVVKRGVGIDVGRGLLLLTVAVGGCWYPDGRRWGCWGLLTLVAWRWAGDVADGHWDPRRRRGCWRSSTPVTWRSCGGCQRAWVLGFVGYSPWLSPLMWGAWALVSHGDVAASSCTFGGVQRAKRGRAGRVTHLGCVRRRVVVGGGG